MRPPRSTIPLAAAVLACAASRLPAAPLSCTGPAGYRACVPECAATWDDHTTKEPCYSMTCEPAGARARDPWHAPRPECRCEPPAGRPYVKKKLFKADGPEHRERVPKYAGHLVPGPVCAVESGHRPWWRGLLGAFLPWSCR